MELLAEVTLRISDGPRADVAGLKLVPVGSLDLVGNDAYGYSEIERALRVSWQFLTAAGPTGTCWLGATPTSGCCPEPRRTFLKRSSGGALLAVHWRTLQIDSTAGVR